MLKGEETDAAISSFFRSDPTTGVGGSAAGEVTLSGEVLTVTAGGGRMENPEEIFLRHQQKINISFRMVHCLPFKRTRCRSSVAAEVSMADNGSWQAATSL